VCDLQTTCKRFFSFDVFISCDLIYGELGVPQNDGINLNCECLIKNSKICEWEEEEEEIGSLQAFTPA